MVSTADEKLYPAKVVSATSATDLAVLKIDVTDLPYLSFLSSRKVHIGDEVFTIGYPLAFTLGFDPKFTDGAISSKSGLKDEPLAYQITVPIQPGNSGGPLVNKFGQVVGVITSTASSIEFLKKSGNIPQNINWAVKSDYVLPLLVDEPPAIKVSNKKEAIDIVEKAICMVLTSS